MNTPILLTNDDGYDAPGIRTLWDCVKALGYTNVRVAAPLRGWSVRGHAATVDPRQAIRVEPLTIGDMQGVVVDGFPADCSRVGIVGLDLFAGQQPLVLAGINAGANLGVDAFYSGTLAAAREAVALGCAAIALSEITGKDKLRNWERTASWVTPLLEWLIPLVINKGVGFWNVNFPCIGEKGVLPPVRVVPMSIDPLAVAYETHQEVPEGLSYCGPYHLRPARPGSDVETIFSGNIAITPMILDHTDYGAMEEIKSLVPFK